MNSIQNKSQHKDYRYEFTVCLCEAIQRKTESMEKEYAEVFYYRGSNLKYAVERAMYFNYINRLDVYTAFLDIYKDQHDNHEAALMNLSKLLKTNAPNNPLRKIKKNLQNVITRFSARRSKKHVSSQTKKIIAFYVPNMKFFNYLKPLFQNLNREFLLMSGFESVKDNSVYDHHLSVMKVSPLFGGGTIGKISHGLSNFNILAQYYDAFEIFLKRFDVKNIVLAEGNSPEHEILNQLGKKNNVQVICIQHGWSPLIHVGFQNMTYHNMLVWGTGFIDLLKNHNPDQKFTIVGNYKINAINNRLVKNGPENKEKYSLAFFLQANSENNDGGLLTPQIVESFYELILWVVENFENCNVLVREHPNAPLSEEDKKELMKFPSVQLVSSQEFSLQDIFSMVHLSVSMYSSVILESIASGIIPIIVNLTSMPKYLPDVAGAGAGIEVNDIDNAKMVLEKILKNKIDLAIYQKALDIFSKKYFSFQGEEARKKACELICQS